MSLKVMMIYPNYRGMNMIPPAMGILSSIMKDIGVDVRLFDTTYYENIDGRESDSDRSKTDRLMAKPYKMPHEITLKTTNCYSDFREEVLEFGPDLFLLSATEDMFRLGIRLLDQVQDLNILTLCGGVLATFAPQLVLSYPQIDIVCKGEGEDAVRELCRCLQNGQSYDKVPNLWIKQKNGQTTINPTKLVDMDQNPLIDMSIFEEARFYRPMGGKVYRMFPVETYRGCPYTCAFCNSPSQVKMYKEESQQKYLRRKSFENMRKELLFYKNEMKAEYLYFWADTFFSWNEREFDQFLEIYQDIALPFWCQTRIETVRLERFQKLKDAGCARISFGLEHGNEQFRREKILRPVSNEMMIKNFRIVNQVGIPYSVNNMMGFPGETYELAFDTVEINRYIDADDRNAYTFTPFHGTPLRKECEELGYIGPNDLVSSMVTEESLLNMPQFPREQVQGLVKTFNMYVRFPKSRWPEIDRAQADTQEANHIYEQLKQEYMGRYMYTNTASFEKAASEVC